MTTYYIIAFMLLILIMVLSVALEKPMWFTIVFIIFISLFIYNITAEFLPVVLTIAGLIFANHSIQPLFYPVIIKSEMSKRYISSRNSEGGFPPFKEGSDPKKEAPKFDIYLHNDANFVIKLPLIPFFKRIGKYKRISISCS